MVHTRSQLRACQGTNEAASVSQISPPESSLGTAQVSSIELNWILFDKSHRIPYIISIPSDLYEGPSQYCRQLFMEELRLRYKVAAEAEDIIFWMVDGMSFLDFSLLNHCNRRKIQSQSKSQQKKDGQNP